MLLLLGACPRSTGAPSTLGQPEAVTTAAEVPVLNLELRGPIATPETEISGLAWFGDRLVLLPQYPSCLVEPCAEKPPRAEDHTEDGLVFTLGRAEIAEAIEEGTPLTPRAVRIRAPGLLSLPGYQGFEAIAFDGSTFYAALELSIDDAMSGLLIKGEIRLEGTPENPSYVAEVDLHEQVTLRPQTEIGNLAYEALTLQDDEVLLFYEANGAANETPRVLRFTKDLEPLPELPIAALEYRLTDATSVDSDGRFWVANYFYPGTTWCVGSCALRSQFGDGRTHAEHEAVERLIELRSDENGVHLVDRPPVQLTLEGEARNWEGLVRFGDGFLLATDMHPGTMLAYVAP